MVGDIDQEDGNGSEDEDEDNDVVTMWKTSGAKAHILYIDATTNLLQIRGNNFIISDVLKQKNLNTKVLSSLLKTYGGEGIWTYIQDGRARLRLVDAISFKANQDSGIKNGHIYATYNYGGRNTARYDFVCISLEDEHGAKTEELAQVLALIEIIINSTPEQILYAAIVQYLRKDTAVSTSKG